MKRDLIVVGAGGHSKALLDVIESSSGYRVKGILGQSNEIGMLVTGYSVTGTDDSVKEYAEQGYSFIIAVGQIKTAQPRKSIAEKLRACRASLATIVAATAHQAASSQIGPGGAVFHFAHIGPHAEIGEHCIVNTHAVVEHDCNISAFCHISTGAILNGGVSVGEESFIGSGAVVREGISIGSRCIIGAGVRVLKSVPDGTMLL
ncbi:MAG: acetyltransferase [Leptospiraceae bacterium]